MSERIKKEQREMIRKHVKGKGTMVDEGYASDEADRKMAAPSGISSSYGRMLARLRKGSGRRRRRTRRKSRKKRRKSRKKRRKSRKKRKSRRRRRR